tara:strand:- start:32660 stop:32959 length:300 start_codon:yes stop_codon:yes gene_type:complete
MNEETETEEQVAFDKKKSKPIGRVLFLVLTALCFAYLYFGAVRALVNRSIEPFTSFINNRCVLTIRIRLLLFVQSEATANEFSRTLERHFLLPTYRTSR